MRDAHAATVLEVAEKILAQLESWPEGNTPKRQLLLLQASFLARLAASLLLEPSFPALPEGFDRLLGRDQARRAARQLSLSRGRSYRSFSKKGVYPALRDRNQGAPLTEMDRRLGAETSTTIQTLETIRLELFTDYLHVRRDSTASTNLEVQAASLALLDRYWLSHRRVLEIVPECPAKLAQRRSRENIMSKLHPPLWENEVTWKLWRMLDQRYLFWSNPVPDPVPPVLSQEP